MNHHSLNRDNQQTMADRWIAALTESRTALMEALSGITQDELHHRIVPVSHSIANYLWHVANVGLWWTQHVVNGEPISYEERTRFGLTSPGDIQEAPRSMSFADLKMLLDETLQMTVDAFRHMPDETFTTPNRPLGKQGSLVSPEWILYNLVDHDANHRGQIAMLLRMMRD